MLISSLLCNTFPAGRVSQEAIAALEMLENDRHILAVSKEAHLKTEEQAFREEVRIFFGTNLFCYSNDVFTSAIKQHVQN